MRLYYDEIMYASSYRGIRSYYETGIDFVDKIWGLGFEQTSFTR